jgi:hypothetical protein
MGSPIALHGRRRHEESEGAAGRPRDTALASKGADPVAYSLAIACHSFDSQSTGPSSGLHIDSGGRHASVVGCVV